MSEHGSVIEVKWNPSARELKQFALYWFPLLYLVGGGLAWWKYAAPSAAWGIWGVGFLLSVAGMVSPAVIRFLFIAISVITFPLGWVVSHLVLGVIFYGVVTPIGLIMRLCGRDPLQRKFDPVAKSYWVPHQPTTDNRRYFRQY